MINKHSIRTRVAAVFIAAAAFSLAGCGGGSSDTAAEGDTTATAEYPAEVRDNFLESCVAAGAPEESCVVCLETIEAEFTYDEFIAVDAAVGAGTADEETTAKLNEIIASCAP